MEYVEILQTCPECGSGLPCYVEARPGFAHCEPDYPVPCRRCGKTVRLELPGPPVEVMPPRRPRFPRWSLRRLGELLWDIVRHAIRRILDAQIDWEAVSEWLFNRRRAARQPGPGSDNSGPTSTPFRPTRIGRERLESLL